MDITKTTDTSAGTSPFSALASMYYQPSQAFAMLRPRRHAWLPLALSLLSSSILMLWYFNIVDIAWLIDQMNASITDVAKREQATKVMSKGMLQGFSLAGAWIAIPVITALTGVYLMLVAKFMSKEFTFGTGFALAAWSSVPNLLLLPLGAMTILLSSNGQISFSELNPLSVNQLFFQYATAHPLAGPLDVVSVSSVWGIALMVIGFQAWAKVSRATALKVVLIPYVTVIGLWFANAMSKAT